MVKLNPLKDVVINEALNMCETVIQRHKFTLYIGRIVKSKITDCIDHAGQYEDFLNAIQNAFSNYLRMYRYK